MVSEHTGVNWLWDSGALSQPFGFLVKLQQRSANRSALEGLTTSTCPFVYQFPQTGWQRPQTSLAALRPRHGPHSCKNAEGMRGCWPRGSEKSCQSQWDGGSAPWDLITEAIQSGLWGHPELVWRTDLQPAAVLHPGSTA